MHKFSLFLACSFALGACAKNQMPTVSVDTGDMAMPATDDAAMTDDGGTLPGNCTQVATWPSMGAQAGYDAMNMVTFVQTPNGNMPPVDVLVVESWQASGEMFPQNRTFKMGDTLMQCDVCVLVASQCDAMGNCGKQFFAQGGTAEVDVATRAAAMGEMKASLSNVTLLEWDTMNDKPVANGACYQVGSASFDVKWTATAPDGGTTDGGATDGGATDGAATDGGVVDLKGADLKATVDMKSSDGGMTTGDGGLGCTPVINEVQATGKTYASDEWVEVYNPCSTAIDLTGWDLWYLSANNNGGPLFKFTQKIAAGGYLLIVGAKYSGTPMPDGTWTSGGLAGGGGAVGLVDPNGNIADSVAYETLAVPNDFTQTSPAPNPPAGESIERLPNGVSTGDNSKDFKVATMPTPKAANK